MRKLVLVIMLLASTVYAMAGTVLISVELPNMESKKSWHQLKIPTYELVGNTAIAEADESQISLIKHRDYQVSIIDRQPELTKYVIISNIDKMSELPGTSIWKNDKTAIIKTLPKGVLKDRKYKHQIRPISIKPLGDRFWTSVTTKYVPVKSIPYDPFIQSLVDQVNADSIAATIQRLQDFQTRVSLTDSSYAASRWLKNKLDSMGISAVYDSFYAIDEVSGYKRNVIGTIDGTMVPQKQIIVGGHFDSAETTVDGVAPGADDNASGTAASMEIGRIMKQYPGECSLIVSCWDGEEHGVPSGSMHYAEQAVSENIDILGVINMDMIGYMNDSVPDFVVGGWDPITSWLEDLYIQCTQMYASELTVYGGNGVADDVSFEIMGYSAIGIIENWVLDNPNYHQVTDLLNTLSPELFVGVTKASIATIGMLGIYPSPVKDVVVMDPGEGTKLVVSWTPNEESDVLGYRIYYGTQSETYTDSVFISGVSSITDTIDSLIKDTTYHVAIYAFDSDNHKSLSAIEVTATPRIVPVIPSGFAASPVMKGVNLSWINNMEGDLAGYLLYRQINQDDWDSLNAVLLFDTTYVDSSLSGANKYYYKIRAYDTDGNYSPLSDSVYCRPITLDQGILVVDETQNWTTGSFPRDAQQDSFYNYILSDYKHEQFEYGSTLQKPILADYVPYSTVIWAGDDYGQLMSSSSISDIQAYLDYGGKLWFAGWKPTTDIRNSLVYPSDFSSGSFLYDYMKVSHVEISALTDSFKTAVGLKGYPNIFVDTLKYPASTLWGKTFRYIEALTPTGTGDTIYVIDMKNDGSPYEGRACAVRDSGKTVLFGFPLYFMDKEQVKLAAQKIMTEFGEPSGVTGKPDNREQIMDIRLYQNAPNPFNRLTTISYQLPKAGLVRLNIYNIAGQLVKTLINQEQPAGSYTVKWDGRDDQNKQVSNGIYFYCLQSSSGNITNRMVLIR